MEHCVDWTLAFAGVTEGRGDVVPVLAAIYDAGLLSLGELEPLFSEVSRRSLQRDLKLLLDKGLILEMGTKAITDPNRSYAPAPDPGPRTVDRRKL